MEKANILVVEDENITAQDIKATLEHLGYSVAGIASTGKDAIEKAEKTKPDLILMDIHLKGKMDGIEASKKISSSSDVPIVFLTAYSDNSVIERAKNVKAFGYIVKPFDEKTLNGVIQMTLQKSMDIKEMMELEKDKEVDLDLHDRKILHEMDIDARISASELGRKLKLPKGTVNYRVSKLIERGYVNKFYTMINTSLLGYRCYRIFIKLSTFNPEMEKQLMEFANNEKNCLKLSITEGPFNLVFLAAYRNMEEVRSFMDRFNSRFGSYVVEKDISRVIKTHKLNQKFLLETFEGGKKPVEYDMTSIDYERPGDYDADETEMKILKLLSSDARIKLVDLAGKIKTDWKAVKYRMKKMEEKGLIAAYSTDLNIPKLKREIVRIDISLKDLSSAPKMIGFFDGTNSCMFTHELVGKYDLSAEVYVSNDAMLKEILDSFQKTFSDSYIHYDVFHVYRDYLINSMQPEPL